MGLKSALQALDDAVKDLTSLHVQTYTGKVTTTFTGEEGFDSVRDTVQKAETDGEILLVAETLAQFDGDSFNFVKQDMDNVPKLALEVHKNAVASGVETRLGLLNLFKDLLKID